ncbi:MAG: DUF6916 family protein [Pyrinomonadaceae bacterium]
MKITRRTFLAATPLAIGAVLQFNGVALGQKVGRGGFAIPDLSQDALSRLTWASFYPFINTDFTFGEGGNAVSLKLVDMTDTKRVGKRVRKGQESFILKFQGPFDKVLAGKTYQVNHFNLGDFDLFITDGGRVKREQYYVAVINRVVS